MLPQLKLIFSLTSQGPGITAINSRVQAVENATVESTNGLSLESLELNSTFPRRPGYGTQGKEVTLYTNHFELTPPKNLQLYRYSVEHKPGLDGRTLSGKKGSWVVKLLLRLHFAGFLNNIVTDYR